MAIFSGRKQQVHSSPHLSERKTLLSCLQTYRIFLHFACIQVLSKYESPDLTLFISDIHSIRSGSEDTL
jgi:hypothetical protein